MSPEPQALCILLVEDSPADIRLTEEALRDSPMVDTLHVARDGEEAMDFLRQRGAHADAPRPDLVLLDLNLPRKNGAEVLAEVKAHPSLRRIPVIVISGSSADQDVRNAYDLHANAYLRKPRDYPGLRDLVETIECFWLEQALLPN